MILAYSSVFSVDNIIPRLGWVLRSLSFFFLFFVSFFSVLLRNLACGWLTLLLLFLQSVMSVPKTFKSQAEWSRWRILLSTEGALPKSGLLKEPYVCPGDGQSVLYSSTHKRNICAEEHPLSPKGLTLHTRRGAGRGCPLSADSASCGTPQPLECVVLDHSYPTPTVTYNLTLISIGPYIFG